MKKLVASLMFLAFFLNGKAQQVMGPEIPYIEVNGTSEMEVTPDEIYVHIDLEERVTGKDAVSVEKQDKDLKSALKELQIPLENLVLLNMNTDLGTFKRKKEGKMSLSYELKLANVEQVQKVFEKLDAMKFDKAFIDRVSYSKMDALRKEARIAAMKVAKEKADYMLNAIGQSTGRALVVREENGYNPYVQYNVRASSLYNKSDLKEEGFSDFTEFKKIKVSISVYIKFEVK